MPAGCGEPEIGDEADGEAEHHACRGPVDQRDHGDEDGGQADRQRGDVTGPTIVACSSSNVRIAARDAVTRARVIVPPRPR